MIEIVRYKCEMRLVGEDPFLWLQAHPLWGGATLHEHVDRMLKLASLAATARARGGE